MNQMKNFTQESRNPIKLVQHYLRQVIPQFIFNENQVNDLIQCDDQGIYVIHYLASFGNVELIRFYLDVLKGLFDDGSFEKYVNVRERGHGRTPLHFAVQYQCFDVARVLLEYGASFNVRAFDKDVFINQERKLGDRR
eukprot:TRINITY_DN4120_c0_g1_i1.p1 TRINITY_DN4120_c0_g1~~TRINITY_DN4120_c0_g1_i1.p1  ORF type:complete len:138 (+),score=24.63 TRINITY_DN4120_c0_g1_i1:61-474(+)